MLTGNLYVQAVEAIYASGLDGELVPEALAATSRLLGARGATLEVIDKATQRPVEFRLSWPAPDRAHATLKSIESWDEKLPSPLVGEGGGEAAG